MITITNGIIKSKSLSVFAAKVKTGMLLIGNHDGIIPILNMALISPDQ
jgi:hypothetical protein